MSYYVYILLSQKDNRYYIGSTSDLKRRIEYHNSGLQRSTKHRVPFKLVYYEVHDDRSSAERREKQIKRYKGGEAFRKLIEGV
jgi:putative endonuclease